MIVSASAVIRLVEIFRYYCNICKNGHTHQLHVCTTYSDVCVITSISHTFPQLLFFLLLLILMNWSSSCLMASQKQLVLHLSLTILWPFPLPKILLACCMAESSHLQNACCTDSNDLRLPLVSCSLYLICHFISYLSIFRKAIQMQPAAHIPCTWLNSVTV